MPEVTSFAPGNFSWVDLSSRDLEASKSFYSRLFGWNADTIPDPEAGGYGMFTLKGKLVAGFGPTMGPDQPSAWSTYIATDDIEATVKAISGAGGQIVAGPMDVFDQGRLAVFVDPTGAFTSLWEARAMRGAQLVNEPGTVCWNELDTRDVETAKRFYTKVFGWGESTSEPGGSSYTEWQLDGRSIGGAMPMPAAVPAEVPSYWLTYFAVDDCDTAVAKAQELGGNVMMAPMDIDPGRFAVLADPQGAAFAVIKMA